MSVSKGGWKGAYVSWIKGEKYSSETSQDVFDFMSDVKDAILSADIWELDPEIHVGEAEDAPLQLDNTANMWTHGLFFVNKTSGSKMCLTYQYKGSAFPKIYGLVGNNWSGYRHVSDIGCSVIPPDSGSFNPSQYNARGFVPDKGTRLCPAVNAISDNRAIDNSRSCLRHVNMQTAAGYCSYIFLMKDDVIGIFMRSSYMADGAKVKGSYFGHIFDDDMVPCPQYETDLPASNFGVVNLQEMVLDVMSISVGGDNRGIDIHNETHALERNSSSYLNGGVLKRTAQMKEMTDTEYYSATDGCWKSQVATGLQIPFKKDDGIPSAVSETGAFYDILVTGCLTASTYQSARYFTGDPAKAISAYGFLRSDMILGGVPNKWTRGQTFDEKNYLYVGGGVIIGWDKTIPFSMFGND